MERVNKIISLEPGKSRFPGLLDYIRPSDEEFNIQQGNYGRIVYNIDFSKIGDIDFFTDFKDLSSLGEMSYRTMMNRYHWMQRLFKRSKFYYRVEKNGNVTWKELESYSSIETYIANLINEDLEEKIFKLGYTVYDIYFVGSTDEDIRPTIDLIGVISDENDFETFQEYKGILFYRFVEYSLGRITIPEEIKGSLVPNFIYLLYIDEYLKQMRRYKSNKDCCNWTKYNEMGGDEIVAFLSKIHNVKDIIENFQKLSSKDTTSLYVSLNINTTIDDMGVMRPDEEKESDLWEEQDSFITYPVYSELYSLRTFRRSMDDYGNELFGIFDYTDKGNIRNTLAFPYIVNECKNIYSVEDENGNIDEYADIIYKIEKTNGKYIFHYVLGGLVKKTNNGYTYDINSGTGLRFVEEYEYEVKEITCIVDGKERTFKYDFINIENANNNATLYDVEHKIGSIYGSSKYIGDVSESTFTYRAESDLGLTENKVVKNRMQVDRGNATAFERHFKLLEVNTFQDLEEYQNNFFNLRQG